MRSYYYLSLTCDDIEHRTKLIHVVRVSGIRDWGIGSYMYYNIAFQSLVIYNTRIIAYTPYTIPKGIQCIYNITVRLLISFDSEFIN